ncbi:MAG: DNA cytosine methyltransferase [Syntrophaceae bacterium]|nr:DNA cytosine methyltransferase [Syntrophaceae bacterium]
MTYKILDLFAGCGGLSLGFDLVRDTRGKKVFEVIRAVEIDKDACATLRNYFRKEYGRDDIVIEGDLTSADLRKRIVRECRGKVAVIVGGPPCQSFSMLGPRTGYGISDKRFEKYKRDRRDRLYKEYLRIVREVRPAFIVFENVKGIISKRCPKGRRYIDIIAADFRRIGYSFASTDPLVEEQHLIVNAADYGVPQIRERVFLIGNNLGIKNPFPKQTHSDRGKHPDILPWTTLRDAIGDLPKVLAKYTFTDLKKGEVAKYKRRNYQRYSGSEKVPHDKQATAKHLQKLPVHGKELLKFLRSGADGTLLYHFARAQKRDDVLLFSGMKEGTVAEDLYRSRSSKARALRKLIKYRMKSEDGEFAFSDKYRKQSWNRPSSTLFAHLAKDGNRFIHPDSRQARTFTLREAARIQTFPDWYEFTGSRGSRFRQIGNAVPPLLAKKIAEAIVPVLSTGGHND